MKIRVKNNTLIVVGVFVFIVSFSLIIRDYFSQSRVVSSRKSIPSTSISSPTPQISNSSEETKKATPSPVKSTYKAPKEVKNEVIYPNSRFIEREEVSPCIATSDDPSGCIGTLGESGGARFIYEVNASYNDVRNWYITHWQMSGGGGEIESDGKSGNIYGAHITEKSGGEYLYYIGIKGDESKTTIIFNSNSSTAN